ncbi:TVP38/TMEM64 family protein [Paenibacillus thalictri]|nr:TVP38/TMEM64 family protein [Paenibacillus thalictri]
MAKCFSFGRDFSRCHLKEPYVDKKPIQEQEQEQEQPSMKRWYVVAVYAIIAALTMLYKDDILFWLRNSQPPVVVMYLVVTFFALIPVIPYSIVIAIMGLVYGLTGGALISWLGGLSASVMMYAVVKYYFHERGRLYIARFRRLEQFTRMIEQNAFFAILFARLIPIIPQALVNTYAGVAAVPFSAYVAASALGKIPGMALYAFVGENVLTDIKTVLIAALVYAVFLLLTFGMYRLWRRTS